MLRDYGAEFHGYHQTIVTPAAPSHQSELAFYDVPGK